jgi:hypothetical protein
MNRAAIEAIIAQYKKHGWELRRVLLTHSLRESLAPEKGQLFGSAEITSADLDAAWFSRTSLPGRETWELRHLGTPYALDIFLDKDSGSNDNEELLRNTENRMREAAPQRRDN